MLLGLDQQSSAKAKPVFSFGVTGTFEHLYKQQTLIYKFSIGTGRTNANTPTA